MLDGVVRRLVDVGEAIEFVVTNEFGSVIEKAGGGGGTSAMSGGVLYLGGGNTKKLTIDLPADVELFTNVEGLEGGVRLWDH